jgi:hypothetical protein
MSSRVVTGPAYTSRPIKTIVKEPTLRRRIKSHSTETRIDLLTLLRNAEFSLKGVTLTAMKQLPN